MNFSLFSSLKKRLLFDVYDDIRVTAAANDDDDNSVSFFFFNSITPSYSRDCDRYGAFAYVTVIVLLILSLERLWFELSNGENDRDFFAPIHRTI